MRSPLIDRGESRRASELILPGFTKTAEDRNCWIQCCDFYLLENFIYYPSRRRDCCQGCFVVFTDARIIETAYGGIEGFHIRPFLCSNHSYEGVLKVRKIVS